jgi:hypothetical protein
MKRNPDHQLILFMFMSVAPRCAAVHKRLGEVEGNEERDGLCTSEVEDEFQPTIPTAEEKMLR